MENKKMPDYLFEVSWEVCNKVGGIHTVLATKALYLNSQLDKHHIHIGPDIWMHTRQNPEFIEDPVLFNAWRRTAQAEGLRVRVGRWNVPGKPVAILVNFTNYISQKDSIFASFWEKYGVDSINGGWDYAEAALFGYASGKVIESFAKFHIRAHQKAVAQFHEWMTGAGLLYLKSISCPIATIFTTHATIAGRCVAGRNMPLYDNITSIDSDTVTRECNLLAKHTLEKAAAHQADVLTTVSDATANECKYLLGREPDIITPNGFVASMAPTDKEYPAARKQAKAKLLEIASYMSGKKYNDKTMLLCISGRYEYNNKGINVFLDALASFSASIADSKRNVAAFIMVPSGTNGPDVVLVDKIKNKEDYNYQTNVSHTLVDDCDIVRKHLAELSLNNDAESKLDVFFVPTYLNGTDGIFNMSYYDLLVGMDLTIFPSYYEPWGYTPLESLAFRVPTLTSSTAGFGMWVRKHYNEDPVSISIVERTGQNYNDVVEAVKERMNSIYKMSAADYKLCCKNALEVSKLALWENNIEFYRDAYDMAIDKNIATYGAYIELFDDKKTEYRQVSSNKPSWSRMLVGRQLPKRLETLDIMAKNLWWCWNQEAIDLFSSLSPDLWRSTNGNPLVMLDKISIKKYRALENDTEFLAKLDCVYKKFSDYMEQKDKREGPAIAYFCMEYGLDTSLKIYSGGLGILAGDYLKEASDMKVNMTAVGLLYRYGYFTQQLSAQGDQVASYIPQDFTQIPAEPVRNEDGKWLTISIALPGRTLYARIWRVQVGRTDLYLLDTDFEDNQPEDRSVTHQLYGGDWENRLKQEILLGVGGVRALRAVGVYADVYHCNEGHAAFMGLERLRELIEHCKLNYMEAMEIVRSSSLFTTHTPVPAGHDAFTEDLLRAYIANTAARLGVDWNALMALGRINPKNHSEKFSMSVLAANLSQEVNGVSWLHGKVSQDILAGMWPGYLPSELHVSYVTNGVHYPTWAAPEWKKIHEKVFGDEFKTHHYDRSCFSGIYKVSSSEIWNTRNLLRKRLIYNVKKIMDDTTASAHYSPRQILQIKKTLRDDVLTIGFARRFATYKRATLLFRNLERLDKIVNNPERPVQFLFAGKAHPADRAGQDLIKRIIEISKMPQFIGKILFIPNYDITLAKLLVQGVDVWMNNPTRPQEASGTSGEKAVMNGVMHFSVLDGWWVEGYKPGAGWALPMERTYDNQEFQNELDAATIYDLVENDIAKIFYAKNEDGISEEWISYIKETIAKVACDFTTNRMMEDYLNKYYIPLHNRSYSLAENDFHLAKEIANWKKHMYREWPIVEVRSFTKPDNASSDLVIGKECISEAVIFIGELDPSEIGVEILLADQNAKGEYTVQQVIPFEVEKFEHGLATYKATITPEVSGAYHLAARMYAKNEALPHRQDFELVKWL
ncbi:MAG: alpha-glucan family phosphorylase [Bacteroidales bacterium]|nr:alpha-glucan family phosphorylase [Bacteroidales bacterium]